VRKVKKKKKDFDSLDPIMFIHHLRHCSSVKCHRRHRLSKSIIIKKRKKEKQRVSSFKLQARVSMLMLFLLGETCCQVNNRLENHLQPGQAGANHSYHPT